MIDLPAQFSDRMRGSLGAEYASFLKSYERPAERAIRVNTLKITAEEFEKISPVPLDGKVPWEANGYYSPAEGLGRHILHSAGLYYVQEPSAMCAVPRLEVTAGERVLDLCSAPGGKGTQIAQYMQGEGVLVLNEIDSSRCAVLKGNVERMGVRNALVTSLSPEKLADYYFNFFDKILVDAPCSGEGMFKKEEFALREWSLKNVTACAVRQAKILESADKMLAGGGRLVYSTCTFAPEEDEGQIENFLKLHPDYKLVSVEKLYPHKVRGEGHFCAVLQKGDGERREDFLPRKDKNDRQLISAFASFIDMPNIRTFGDSLYSAVEGLPAEFRSGVRLGDVKNGRFEPSHALAMCLKKDDFDSVEVDEKTALNYLRGLTFDCPHKDGWRLVTYLNYPLGWCKVSKGVAKNHLPKGLRI